MASTPADICNVALGRIGQRQFIEDMDEEDSTEALAARVHYELSRDVVLCAYRWRFATSRSTLALSEETRTGWTYTYALPTDCLDVRYLVMEGYPGEPPPHAQAPFQLEANSLAPRRLLLTELEQAELVYTRRLTEVSLFPPLFTNALAWKLSADFALTVAVKPQMAMAMETRYLQALREAAAMDFRQGKGQAEPEGSYIRART